MRGIDNDDAIAYGLVAVVVFLAGAALIFVCFTPAMNDIVEAANGMVADGTMGVQTRGAMDWNLGLFAAIPVISLLGIMAWAYIRSLEAKGE